jgi:hypothetical protein
VPGAAVGPVNADGAGSGERVSSGAANGWAVESREHVDLWLHGFAMLTGAGDSSLVPYFRPGYYNDLSQARRALNASSQLDANAMVLSRRLSENAGLVSAQFLSLYFANWSDLRAGCEHFLRDQGDVRAAPTNEAMRMYATLATYFPTSADRDWLRLFLASLDDERTRFFRGYWAREQASRAAVRAQFVSIWNGRYSSSLGRFMRGANQRRGTVLLSFALGGEGRTLALGQRDNFVAVTFPADVGQSTEVLYTIAHEVVGGVSNAVVRDNASAADQRSGDAGRWTTLAPVRGGLLLLERVAPELSDGYRRYYLRLARQTPSGDVARQFATVFPLPPAILAALERQVQLVLDGI